MSVHEMLPSTARCVFAVMHPNTDSNHDHLGCVLRFRHVQTNTSNF